MSSIPRKTDDGNSVSGFATKFMKRFQLGKLLFKCNAGKEKGIPVMDIFRYLFCMMFSDRSIFSAAEDKNLLCEGVQYDGRSLAGRRRRQARRKATDVMEYFHITEAQLEEFTASFIQRLPKYIQEALGRKEIAV